MRRIMVMTAMAMFAGAVAVPAASQRTKPARGVKGTTQMAGDNGKMGVTYTIGKGGDAINFTLVSAEYSTSRIAVPERLYIPRADEKCLVLHYTLHNPNPREFTVNGATLNFTAVDSKDINRPFAGRESLMSIKEGTNESVNIALKPAQKVAVRSAVIIPADASVPKLIVQRGSIQPVLRLYFKPGEVKPVPKPYADPADSTGCKALANVPAVADTFYEAGHFDAKLIGTSYTTAKLAGRAPAKGQQYFVATVVARCGDARAWTLNGFTFQSSVKTADGEKTRVLPYPTLKAQRDESAGQSVEAGQEYTIRICIPIPADTKATEFTLREGEGYRTFVFNVGGTQ